MVIHLLPFIAQRVHKVAPNLVAYTFTTPSAIAVDSTQYTA